MKRVAAVAHLPTPWLFESWNAQMIEPTIAWTHWYIPICSSKVLQNPVASNTLTHTCVLCRCSLYCFSPMTSIRTTEERSLYSNMYVDSVGGKFGIHGRHAIQISGKARVSRAPNKPKYKPRNIGKNQIKVDRPNKHYRMH